MEGLSGSESEGSGQQPPNTNPALCTKPTSLICTRSTPFHRFLKTLLTNPKGSKEVDFEIHPDDDQPVTFPSKAERAMWKSSKTPEGGTTWEGTVVYGDAVQGAYNINNDLQTIDLKSYDKYKLSLLWAKTSVRPRTHRTLDAMVHDVERAMSRSKRNSTNDRARIMASPYGSVAVANFTTDPVVPRPAARERDRTIVVSNAHHPNNNAAPFAAQPETSRGRHHNNNSNAGAHQQLQPYSMLPGAATIPMHVNMPSEQFRLAVAEPIAKPDGMQQYIMSGVTEYPYEVIENATGYFSDTFKMASGPFGVSYNVVLNGQRVIIKAIECEELLRTHVEYVYSAIQEVANLKHDNIVPLIGFCVRARCVFLVSEYQPFGSLTQRLYTDPASQAVMLTWQDRLKIATGIARGLAYMQLNFQLPSVHMDIKSSNIMLTHNGDARIAECGVSRLIPGPKQLAMAICTPSMHGRVDPEYLFKGALTVSSDIFSFGIIVLELISGQSAFVSVITPPDLYSQVQEVYKISRDSNEVLDRMQDKRIPEPWPRDVLRALLDLATQCASLRAVERPNIQEIILKLEEINRVANRLYK